MSNKGKKPKVPMTPAWERYWADPKAPHPDSILSPMGSPSTAQRVLAPFRYSGSPSNTSSHDKRESWYCHHYRLPGEHYHKTMAELERCND